MAINRKKEKEEVYFSGPDRIEKQAEQPEFSIHTALAELPVSGCPSYLKEAVKGVCTSGTATVLVFNTKFRILPGMVLTLLPWQLVSIKEISDDFRFTFFRISRDMFTDTLSSLWRLTPGFFFYMSKHIVSEVKEENIRRFLNFCDLLAYRMEHTPELCRRESIMQLLRVCYWDRYVLYLCDPAAHIHPSNYTRKEELAFHFLRMILEEHAPDKDVACYAEELGVSPKYLTNLIRSISGRSARDWIVYFTILEIKSLLRESTLDLKSIAARTRFPDQSALSRFFRHYTGMTPSKYRKTIFF